MRRPRREADPSPIGDVLPGLLRGIKGASRGPLDGIRRAWVEILGPAMASRTRIASFSSGKLRVEVASAALKHDLTTFRAPEVLRRLREMLPDEGIREVSYRVAALR